VTSYVVETPSLRRIGEVRLTWGESVRWDDRRQRLYFVDCASQTLHWLDGAEPPLHTLKLASLPTGIALTDGDAIVVCLDDGLHVVDPDAGTSELLAAYPEGMHGRANDANADPFGNLVTGTLNVAAGPGALWWFSSRDGWRLLDNDFGNTNGPVVIDVDGTPTLVCGDTIACVAYAYPYGGSNGTVGERRVFGDHGSLDGAPDGATADADNGVWSCVLRSGKLARFTSSGVDRVVDLPMASPSDVAFGGEDLATLYLTSIALDLGEGRPVAAEAGWLIAIDGLATGRPEARFSLG
jgi:L-arabinonolactonase